MTGAKDSRESGSWPTSVDSGQGSRPYAIAAGVEAGDFGEPARDPRVKVVAQVRLRYGSILDFYQTQSLNISRTGMFIATDNPGAVGSPVDFEFALADGLMLLKGKGEVVRTSQSPVRGMGIRFTELEGESRTCLEHIVATNEREGRTAEVARDLFERGHSFEAGAAPSEPLRGATRVQPGLVVKGHELHIRLTPLTAGYFTNNPLINIRLGGFVVPIDEEVSLGTLFDVAIVDNDGVSLFHGRGKVVAKHERRIGVRLAEADKNVLAHLQAEVANLGPGGR